MLGGVADLDVLLGAAAAEGFTMVGLDVDTLEHADLQPGELVRRLDAHNLTCFEMLGLEVGEDDSAAIERAGTIARWVGESGAAFVLTVGSAPVNAETIDRFARCADLTVAQGGRYALEFIPFLTVDTLATARQFCDDVGRARAGVLIDCWHVERGATTLAQVAATPAEEIAYVQFDDALPVRVSLPEESIGRRTWPGHGEFALTEFATAIGATGYAGPVSVEILNDEWRHDGMHPVEFAHTAMVTASPYWR